MSTIKFPDPESALSRPFSDAPVGS
jgi:hypothetical protein